MTNGTPISSSSSEHAEVDQVEEMLGRLGSYGNIPEVPVANSARSVFFVAPTAQGTGDGSTAGNALAGTYDVISSNGTANVRDVFVFLQGSYDFNGATSGLAFVAGVKVFGLGQFSCICVNSNASATYVMNITVNSVDVTGFYFNENTLTVEDIYSTSDYLHLHDNIHVGAAENHIHCDGSYGSIIEDNLIVSGTNDGIELTGNLCYENTIRNNRLWGQLDNGINLNGDQVDANWIIGNYINGSGGVTDVGINVVLGDNNEIVDNEIWGCVLSEQDTGTANQWNNKYPKKQVVYPQSGGGKVVSGSTAEAWGTWVPVVTPSAPFEVQKVEVHIREASRVYVEVGMSGGDSDIFHLDTHLESGVTMIDTLPKPHFYPQGTPISARTKTGQGSGISSDVWVFTNEPT